MSKDKMVKALKGAKVKDALAKTETVIFRCSKADKQTIKDTAELLKMNVSEYLVSAHKLIAAKVR